MDVEGGVDHLGELEEVGVGGVGGAAAEDSLECGFECGSKDSLVDEKV